MAAHVAVTIAYREENISTSWEWTHHYHWWERGNAPHFMVTRGRFEWEGNESFPISCQYYVIYSILHSLFLPECLEWEYHKSLCFSRWNGRPLGELLRVLSANLQMRRNQIIGYFVICNRSLLLPHSLLSFPSQTVASSLLSSYRTPMTPPLSRVIYFSLDTDRLFTNFDAALHQEFISLGEVLDALL